MPFFILAGVTAATGLAGAAISSAGAQSAANTQAQAAQQASQVEQQQFAQTTANEQPFLTAGTNSLQALQQGLGLIPGSSAASGANGSLTAPYTAADYQQSPDYNFIVNQGEDALLNKQSAIGGVAGGNSLKALQAFGQQEAETDYQQAYQNYYQQQQARLAALQQTSGSGQNAAANLGGLGASTASSVANNITGAGNAQAAAGVAGTNALSGALTGGANSLSQSYLLSQLMSGGGSASGGYGTLAV